MCHWCFFESVDGDGTQGGGIEGYSGVKEMTAPNCAMEVFDVGLGWTLTEAFELRREIEGPAPLTSYRTPPARIVPSDPILRCGLLVVASLDEAADEQDVGGGGRGRRRVEGGGGCRRFSDLHCLIRFAG